MSDIQDMVSTRSPSASGIDSLLAENREEEMGPAINYNVPFGLFTESTNGVSTSSSACSPGVEQRPSSNAPQWDDTTPMTPETICTIMRYVANTTAPLPRVTLLRILKAARDVMTPYPNIEPACVPAGHRCAVFGDVHGQLFDLIHGLRRVGADLEAGPLPEDLHLVFLGDYVDRGALGTEIVLLLCALKLAYPDRVHLIRGNHECRPIFTAYGFADEVRSKYGQPMLEAFAEVFRALPLGVVINDAVLCVHAGPPLSTENDGLSIAEVNGINRFIDSFEESSAGALAVGTSSSCTTSAQAAFDTILWSDPAQELDDYQTIEEVLDARGGFQGGNEAFDYVRACLFARRLETLRERAALPGLDAAEAARLSEAMERALAAPPSAEDGSEDEGEPRVEAEAEGEEGEEGSDDDQYEFIDRYGVWKAGISHYDYFLTKSLGPAGSDVPRVAPSNRGAGYTFSYECVRRWLTANGLTHCIRGHQAQQRGWARHWMSHADRDGLEFWTVFSASNYNQMSNSGACLMLGFDENQIRDVTVMEPTTWKPLQPASLPRPQIATQSWILSYFSSYLQQQQKMMF